MSLDLDALRMFVRVAEVTSFTRAAEQLSIPKARVSHQVRSLESQLGCRLFHRTTRSVRMTPDGEQLFERAKALVSEADDLEASFSTTAGVRGVVRIDTPVSLARSVVIPRLRELFAAHPHIEIQLSSTDRFVDTVREGFDCVLRVGALSDSELVATRVGELRMVNCASPEYLRAKGKPRTVGDLDGHWLVHYATVLGSDAPEFEWVEGQKTRSVRMRCLISVNNTDAFRAAVAGGLGIAQIPLVGAAPLLESGELVEVLPQARCAPLPVSVLHSHGRRVPRRVRVVLDWLVGVLKPHLGEATPKR